ncbi:MAG: hypothetical protein AAGB01_05055 [Cyanobacteria bacterium P01_F01_bin.42]
MKKAVVLLMSALAIACSQQSTDVSKQECDAWGGSFVDGECRKDLNAEECSKVGGEFTDKGCEVEP